MSMTKIILNESDMPRYYYNILPDLPEPLARICREIPEERFREDISSTEIRQANLAGPKSTR